MDQVRPPETHATTGFSRTVAVCLLVIGWAALMAAAFLPLLSAVQAIGIGLGALVTVRVVQHWRTG